MTALDKAGLVALAAKAALIAHLAVSAFTAGMFAAAMPALSWAGIAVSGVTAPEVYACNMVGGNCSGIDIVPEPLRPMMFDFDRTAAGQP